MSTCDPSLRHSLLVDRFAMYKNKHLAASKPMMCFSRPDPYSAKASGKEQLAAFVARPVGGGRD